MCHGAPGDHQGHAARCGCQQSGLHCPYLVGAVRLDTYIQLGSSALAVPGLTWLVNLVRWKISRVHCFQVLHLPPDLLDPLAQGHDRAQYSQF